MGIPENKGSWLIWKAYFFLFFYHFLSEKLWLKWQWPVLEQEDTIKTKAVCWDCQGIEIEGAQDNAVIVEPHAALRVPQNVLCCNGK